MMDRLLREATALDSAVYDAIAATPTPLLDGAMTKLSDSGNGGRVWFAIAAAMAVTGGPKGRRAALRGTSSLLVASAFAFATGAAQCMPAASAPLRALATLIAYSRVHVGVHFPVDVLAGAFIGVSSAEVAARL